MKSPRTGLALLRRLSFLARGLAWAGTRGGRPPADERAGPGGDGPNPLRSWVETRREGRGISKWSHYLDVYHRHLSRFVGSEVTLLEVGVWGGGSLEMWRAYFGERCAVIGVDIEEACRAFENDWTRIFVGDQADRAFWARVKREVPRIDILVDDGAHRVEEQIVTLEEMLPHLAPGGVYVCEDTHGTLDRFGFYAAGLARAADAFHLSGEDVEFAQMGRGVSSTPSGFQREIAAIHSYPYVTVIEKTLAPPVRFECPNRGSEWLPARPRESPPRG